MITVIGNGESRKGINISQINGMKVGCNAIYFWQFFFKFLIKTKQEFCFTLYKSYKYRIYPNKKQQEELTKIFGACRFVYNKALEYRIQYYQQNQKDIRSFELSKLLTTWKTQAELEWLKEVDSQALQQELRHLDNAFTMFYKKKNKFPKFKSKKQYYQTYNTTYASRTYIDFENKFLRLCKVGKIKIKIDRIPLGRFLHCTIIKTNTNKYFIAATYEQPNINVQSKPIIENTAIGIDLGLKTFITLSTGQKIIDNSVTKNDYNRLKILQKRKDKKQKDSKNREKARLKLALQYEKICNKRKDFLQKLVFDLTHDNQVDTICLETLNITGMLKNHNLASSIQHAAWRKFVNLLIFKTLSQGKNILQIGQFEPSSKLCTCGYKNVDLKLSDRIWTCPKCGTTHDRDILAANNIKRFALSKRNLNTGLVGSEEPLEMLSLDRSMN